MSDLSLIDVDPGPYLALLADSDSAVTRIEVCDTAESVIASASLADEHSEAVVEVAAFQVADIAGEPLAVIKFYCSDSTSGRQSVWQAAADLLTRDIHLGTELNDLTLELSARYEELNLIYHTEDKASMFKEGQVALNKLVQNCCEYLDVSGAALIFRDHGVYILQGEIDGEAGQPFLDVILGDFYDAVFPATGPVALNDESELCSLVGALSKTHRLLATPVGTAEGDPIGILVTVNGQQQRRFNNGDKNLLNVMARKASKIVQSSYDPLTGSLNRAGFEYYLENAIHEKAARGIDSALMFIDVDNLHVINDTIGYQQGDQVLKLVSQTMRAQMRESDALSRLGGDRFGVLVQPCKDSDAARVAEKIRNAVAAIDPAQLGLSVPATVSIGVAALSTSLDSPSAAIAAVELTCALAKEKGGNCIERYQNSDTELKKRREHIHTVSLIQRALAEDQFVLYGQPIVALKPGTTGCHLEILLRHKDERGAIQAPGKFLPAAERYFMMPEIDRWVIRNTFAYFAANPLLLTEHCRISINISGQSFVNPDFVDFVINQFAQTSLSPHNFCFEVTETAAIRDLSDAQKFIARLREIGCEFSLDDFGAGLSSFGYLRTLDVDYLKIDGALVREVLDDHTMLAMVKAINEVGHAMELRTIAEYVENEAISACMAELGVDYGQGYGLGKPMPLADFVEGRYGPAAALG